MNPIPRGKQRILKMAQFDMKQMKRLKGEPVGNTLLLDALEFGGI